MPSIQSSVEPARTARVQYLLRLADTCLILGQRLGEWCGHAPVLEEDIALTNMALDLIGQSRALLVLAGGTLLNEDQLAFLREERDYLNPTVVELPRGDFGFTVLRNAMVCAWLRLMWERLSDSSDAQLSGIAQKAVKEARYHERHSADWVVRLGDGTAQSQRRMHEALQELWPYCAELFECDAVDEFAVSTRLGPRGSDQRDAWLTHMQSLLTQAQLTPPAQTAFRSTGRAGRHSEHLGHLLSEMQYLQRAYPGGSW